MDQALDGYDDATLGQLERVLTDVVAVTTARNAHLREGFRPGATSSK